MEVIEVDMRAYREDESMVRDREKWKEEYE